jgi:hypothetical protein
MSSFLIVTMVLAMFAALGALALGLISMVKGGEFDKKYSTRLMQARVLLQGLALLCLALAWMQSTH